MKVTFYQPPLPPNKRKRRINVEIPDDLIVKTLAVTSEIIDRAWDELEERLDSQIEFPLVPFPFPKKYRVPDKEDVGDLWLFEWLSTSLFDNIMQRSQIVEILENTGAINIQSGPTPGQNLNFDSRPYIIQIKDEELLLSLNEKIVEATGTFTVTFAQQKIIVNEKYHLATVEFEGTSDQFFSYVFKNAGKVSKKDDIEKRGGRIRRMSQILNDLRFKGEIRKAFFPKTSGQRSVVFRKTVNRKIMEKEGIDENKLIKELEQTTKNKK